MFFKNINELWGTGHDKSLFVHLIILEFLNSLFLWIFLTVWTIELNNNNFSTDEIAIVYAVSQICRILNAFYLKSHTWYSSIIALSFNIIGIIPAIFYPKSIVSHILVAFYKGGDLLTYHIISLSNILTNRSNIGSSKIVEYRYRYSNTLLICIWVFGYSLSLLTGGYIYEKTSFKYLLIMQLFGVLFQIIYLFILKINKYTFNLIEDVSLQNKVNENNNTINKKFKLSLLDIFLLFILPLPIYGSSALNWQYMPVIYKIKFNFNPFQTSMYLMLGDLLATLFLMLKIQNKNMKINLWCFREPRQITSLIFMLGIFTTSLSSNILVLTLTSNIMFGIIFPFVNKIHSNYISVYSKNKNIKLFNGCYMIMQHIGRSITAVASPYLFDIYPGLPFQINGILLILLSILSFFIFKRHIILNYKDEHIMTLSKSILKLEIEKYHIEKHEKYESKEEITL